METGIDTSELKKLRQSLEKARKGTGGTAIAKGC